jgi:hypothetical protein
MSEKFQIPSSKSQGKFNHQTVKRRENVAPFRWDFLNFARLGFTWNLGFGPWDLRNTRSLITVRPRPQYLSF